jgi:DNA-binding NarL/FixJ family response regulator
MLKAGAVGYLLKSGDPAELARAIRVVAEGRYYLSPDAAGSVVDGFVHPQNETEDSSHGPLSSRELQVLRFLAEGKTTHEIAMLLQIGRKTVETYRRRVMVKLGLHTLADLIKYALREGLADPEN